MAAKPVVDRLAQRHGDRLRVFRLNIQDPANKSLARQYGFQYTPTFLLFDAQGELLLRSVGAIDPDAVDRLIGERG
jgi:thioredoxin-related protein